MKLKQRVNSLLCSNSIHQAIDLVLATIPENESEIRDSFVLIKARLTKNEQDNHLGIVSREDYTRTNNQIIYGIQHLINDIPQQELELLQVDDNEELNGLEQIDFNIHKNNTSSSKSDILQNNGSGNASLQNITNSTITVKIGANSFLPENKLNIPFDYFISHLKKPYYISRSVNLINKDQHNNEKSNPQKLWQILLKEENVILLGNPGIGKSVELKNLAFTLVKKETYYPVFIFLSNFTTDNNLEYYIPDGWKDIPDEKLVLIMDGLDEVNPNIFLECIRKVDAFSNNHPKIKMVISCRTNFHDLLAVPLFGFKTYLLDDLTVKDIADFIQEKYNTDSKEFWLSANNLGYSDLVSNPFYLELLAEDYFSNGQSFSKSRIILFEKFIDKTFNRDEKHFAKTKILAIDRSKVKDLLQRIAFCMQMSGNKTITESQLQEFVLSRDEFELISRLSIFCKDSDESKTWKFVHNILLEYFCAKSLTKLSFQQVISIVSYPGYTKIIPYWANTLAQLLSILDKNSELHQELYNNLLSWILVNDKESLVRVERDKLDIEIREEVFFYVFEHFRKEKIWIRSPKFTSVEYALFAQSSKTVCFILDEIKNTENERTVRLNALSILCDFDFRTSLPPLYIKAVLLTVLNEENAEAYLLDLVLEACLNCGYTDNSSISEIYELIKHRANQRIRNSFYRLLKNSLEIDPYIDYLLDGYNYLRRKNTDRADVIILGEKTNLLECLKRIKKPVALKKLIHFLGNENHIYHEEEYSKLLSSVVLTGGKAYEKDKDIYDSFFELININHFNWSNEYMKIAIDFFEYTKTKRKVFQTLFERVLKEQSTFNESFLLSYFVDLENINQLIEAYNAEKLLAKQISYIYHNVKQFNLAIEKEIKTAIEDKTDIVFEEPQVIDYEKQQREDNLRSFQLLFDKKEFITACEKIFNNKDTLEPIDFKKINEENNSIPRVARNFVYFSRDDHKVNKDEIISYLQNASNFEILQIGKIYRYLKDYSYITANPDQVEFIREWCKKNMSEIDFNTAISVEINRQFTISNYAIYFAFFTERCNLEWQEELLLDMLSFAYTETHGLQTISFGYLESKLEKRKINQRLIDNINQRKIKSTLIYNVHVEYIFKNKLHQAFRQILTDLCENFLDDYAKERIIGYWFQYDAGLDGIKSIIDNLSVKHQLLIAQKLLEKGDKAYIISFVDRLSTKVELEEDKRSINNLLISCSQIEGLKLSIEWIKQYKKSPFGEYLQKLHFFEDIEALPYFIELLDLSYDKSIELDHMFDSMVNFVTEGMGHLALVSSKNFGAVISALEKFIEEKSGTYQHVHFLNNSIISIKEKYYSAKIPQSTIKKAYELFASFNAN